MKTFEFDTIPSSYNYLIKELIKNGKKISPRGIETLEITPASITIKEPLKNVILSPARKLNYGFMLGELAWILQGSNDAHHIAHYNKNWMNFSDDGMTLNGAYGQRIFRYSEHEVNQFENVIELLKNDKNSRQGTIVLFDPNKDFKETKDKPCTNLMRFSIRNDKLNLLVLMRSNDIMFGYPYDVFNFTVLQKIMANRLGIEVGIYTHVVDSLHLYVEQMDWCEDIANEESNDIYKEYVPINNSFDNDDVQTFLNVEQTTRKLTNEINLKHIFEMIENIKDKYWQSNAAFLAMYNYRKNRNKNDFLKLFHPFINNEFKYVLDRYKELK